MIDSEKWADKVENIILKFFYPLLFLVGFFVGFKSQWFYDLDLNLTHSIFGPTETYYILLLSIISMCVFFVLVGILFALKFYNWRRDGEEDG